MIRLLVYATLVSIVCKLIAGRWPWDYLRTRPGRGEALYRARKLLGVDAEASHAEIIEAHRRLVAIVHPDRGGTSELMHEANAARDLLIEDLPGS